MGAFAVAYMSQITCGTALKPFLMPMKVWASEETDHTSKRAKTNPLPSRNGRS